MKIKKDYEKFQRLLTKRQIILVNSSELSILPMEQELGYTIRKLKKADNISFYIAHDLDWNILYTSGHWWSVISAWVSIHTKVLKDESRFIKEFELISSKLKKNEVVYTDFISRLNYFLKEEGKRRLYEKIELIVKDSKKMDNDNTSLKEYPKN